MKILVNMRASVLNLVIVISILMLLAVLAVLMIWEADYLLFSRTRYLRVQEDNIRSTLVLYSAHPEILDCLPDNNIIQLYNSGMPSEMILSRKDWGLYEILTVSSLCGIVNRTRILGLKTPLEENPSLWYRNKKSSVTITGRTIIEGAAFLPDNGVVYDNIQTIFFNGIKLDQNNIKISECEMLNSTEEADVSLQYFFAVNDFPQTQSAVTDSIVNSFINKPIIVPLDNTTLSTGYYSGNIILRGENIRIDSTAMINNVIIVADKIVVGEGFSGSAQLLARDTIIIEDDVILKYPSGCYCERYGEMGEHSEVNGYFIVNSKLDENIKNANFIKSVTSVLRGLLYVSGTAHIQGIITGSAFIDRAVIYSQYGYYDNMISNLTILNNTEIAYPLWLDADGPRKEVVWVD